MYVSRKEKEERVAIAVMAGIANITGVGAGVGMKTELNQFKKKSKLPKIRDPFYIKGFLLQATFVLNGLSLARYPFIYITPVILIVLLYFKSYLQKKSIKSSFI